MKTISMSSALMCSVVALLIWMVPGASNEARAASTNFSACSRCPGSALVWSDGEYDQIYLSAPITTLRNQHPKDLNVDGLTDALLKLRQSGSEKAESLFSTQHARKFAEGITNALAKASSQQDALFLVTTSRRGAGWFKEKRGYSGRAYIDEQGLHLIFGGADIDFVDQYHGTKRQPNFDFGNRERASAATLHVSGLSMQRNDWVTIPIAALNNTGRVASHVMRDSVKEKGVVPDERYYAAQEIRLRRLKGLMDQDLITRDEYERKRKSIMDEW